MPTNPIGGGQIGRSIPRLEAREKVTGRAEYTHLMRLPGMLHGKIFRSTVPHGRIKSVDTSAAKKIPGVFRVITADDVRKVIPDPYYGPAFHDQPILAMDKVRFVGEPVAVVLAADPHIADAAVQAGSTGERLFEQTASAMSCFASIWPSADEAMLKVRLMRPATRSVTTCGLPGYGTWVILTPVRCANISAHRCGRLPLPTEPNSNWPGFALASAISSATLLTPSSGLTASTKVPLASGATGAKSLRMSKLTSGLTI